MHAVGALSTSPAAAHASPPLHCRPSLPALRMYLLEHTSAVQARYRMQAGDVLVFSRLPDGRYGIAGRKVRRQPTCTSGECRCNSRDVRAAYGLRMHSGAE